MTHTGTVKFYNEKKEFGFITEEQTGKDYFIGGRSLKGVKIQTGDFVEFDTEETAKGHAAINVKKVEQ